MAANINDKFSKVSTGIRPKTTAVAGVRAPSGTTLTCDDLTGWTTDTAVHFVTYKADAQGKVVAGSQTDFKGIVSGNSIINLTVTGGNDNGNAVGDIVQALPTAGFAKDLADGLLVSHNPDGTLKDDIVTTAALAANTVDTQSTQDGAITPRKSTTEAFSGVMSNSSITTSYKNFASQTLPTVSAPHKYLITANFSINHENNSGGREYTVAIRSGSTVLRTSRTDSPTGTYGTFASVSAVFTSSASGGQTINFSATVNNTTTGVVSSNSNWVIVDLGRA